MKTSKHNASMKAVREEATALAAQLKMAQEKQIAAKARYKLSKAAAKRAKKVAKRARKGFKAARKEVAALQKALRLAARNAAEGPKRVASGRRKQSPSSSKPVKRQGSSRAKKSGRPVRSVAVRPGRKQPKSLFEKAPHKGSGLVRSPAFRRSGVSPAEAGTPNRSFQAGSKTTKTKTFPYRAPVAAAIGLPANRPQARLAPGASSQPKPVPPRSEAPGVRRTPAVRKLTQVLAPSARPQRTLPREVEAPIEHAATVPEAVTAVPAPVVPVVSAAKEPMADDATLGPEPAASADV